VSTVETDATIGGLLGESGLLRSEAELLLRSVLGCERSHLLAHAEEAIDSSKARLAQDVFARRRAGEPIAYITGWREFYGIRLCVTPDVLIPRPETELLVELALERVAATSSARVLELGTGSGAIAVALARDHGAAIAFVYSDWFEALEGRFGLIVSNPPYVAASDAHLERGDVRFEPRLALVGGEDGLACIRAIAARAQRRLRPGGWLLLEHGYDQGDRCIGLFREFGYSDVEDFEDLAGVPRVCAGRLVD